MLSLLMAIPIAIAFAIVPAAFAVTPLTIKARAAGGTSTEVDVGNDGFGAGDYLLFADRLKVQVTLGDGGAAGFRFSLVRDGGFHIEPLTITPP